MTSGVLSPVEFSHRITQAREAAAKIEEAREQMAHWAKVRRDQVGYLSDHAFSGIEIAAALGVSMQNVSRMLADYRSSRVG